MSDEHTIEPDEKGYPMLFANKALRPRAPGQVAPQPVASGASVNRGARSGNTNADPASGRFAGKGGKKNAAHNGLSPAVSAYIQQQAQAAGADQATYASSGNDVVVTLLKAGQPVATFTVPGPNSEASFTKQFQQQLGLNTPTRTMPDGVDQETWEKRLDLVRDAAREMDDMKTGDAKEFLNGRATNASQVDLEQFVADVREQRLDDLTDILDQQLRGKIENMKRSRRVVKVTAPKGFTKRVFAGLSDDEVLKVVTRLEGRGWDPEDLKKNIISKVSSDERRTKLEQTFGEKTKKGKKAKK